ncbi:MAG: hypothetical protein EMLJLAPB_00713 [Candidatus Argoarchaeum ethanivorans]|uniref:SIR2-like domain-containing protein n=1 Tax=Candidatus Argoarchaeum ethanivorans TaxID=2608793 RepID=A0A811TFB6_9EURY|nr:MAG: hypothetical protein EMLJLAPB_00713 [Candidatus Argoarchaeum ethanivorans]
MYKESITNGINEIFGSKIVFFVGAGISKNSGVPTFIGLNEEIIRSIATKKLTDNECKNLSKNIRPEVVLQIGVEELNSDVLVCLEKFLGYNPNTNHVFLAEAIRRGNWVFTTNQENLIEEAYKEITGVEINRCYENTHFEKFVKKYHINENPNPKGMPGYLFKLHGTIEEDKKGKERFKSILVALNQVGKGLDEHKQKVLKYFLENCDLCFMGYSCQDDFSIYPVLLNTNSGKSTFWFEWFERVKEPISGLIWGKDRLQYEKEREENKSPGEERSWEIINVNNFLLKRKNSIKLVGDSSEYVKNYVEDNLCSLPKISEIDFSTEKREKNYNAFDQWAKDIDEFKRDIFIGRLFEHIQSWNEAEQYYKKAINIAKNRKDRKQLLIAKQKLADLYYRQDIREKEDKAIRIYKDCVKEHKELKNDFKVAYLKVDISNVLRRQGKEKYLFSWDDVSRKNEKRFREFLVEDLKINLRKNAKIRKTDDRTIAATWKKKPLTLKLNKEKNTVTLEIGGVKKYGYISKKGNGKLNIYQENYIKAKDYAEKAEKQLKPIYLKAKKRVGMAKKLGRAIKDEDETYMLGYARCLNVLGLAYWALGKIGEGKDKCNESKKIKMELGDWNGVAESDNAIALILTREGRELAEQGKHSTEPDRMEEAKVKFNEAIDHLKDALNTRKKYGFYRGCAQQCRNIGDAYRELMKIKEEKEYFFQKAEEKYKEGIDFWKLIKPEPPIGEILHYNQRIAGLYTDFVDLIVENKKKKKYIHKIIFIYKSEILNRPKMLQEIKGTRREFDDAKNILKRSKELCEEMDVVLEIKEIDKLLEKLTN